MTLSRNGCLIPQLLLRFIVLLQPMVRQAYSCFGNISAQSSAKGCLTLEDALDIYVSIYVSIYMFLANLLDAIRNGILRPVLTTQHCHAELSYIHTCTELGNSKMNLFISHIAEVVFCIVYTLRVIFMRIYTYLYVPQMAKLLTD
jgi:hypothetical protein